MFARLNTPHGHLVVGTLLIIMAYAHSPLYSIWGAVLGLLCGFRGTWKIWPVWLQRCLAVSLISTALSIPFLLGSPHIWYLIPALLGGSLIGFAFFLAAQIGEPKTRRSTSPKFAQQTRPDTSWQEEPKTRETQDRSVQPQLSPLSYYSEILGLRGRVTRAMIKSAFRDKIKLCHPDRYQNASPAQREIALNKTQQLNAAYQYFKDNYGL